MPNPRRSRNTGLLRAWAGDSLWRQFVAWLAQSAVLLALGAVVFAITWFVMMPWMIEAFTNVMRAP